jgi:hypothetical protein
VEHPARAFEPPPPPPPPPPPLPLPLPTPHPTSNPSSPPAPQPSSVTRGALLPFQPPDQPSTSRRAAGRPDADADAAYVSTIGRLPLFGTPLLVRIDDQEPGVPPFPSPQAMLLLNLRRPWTAGALLAPACAQQGVCRLVLSVMHPCMRGAGRAGSPGWTPHPCIPAPPCPSPNPRAQQG